MTAWVEHLQGGSVLGAFLSSAVDHGRVVPSPGNSDIVLLLVPAHNQVLLYDSAPEVRTAGFLLSRWPCCRLKCRTSFNDSSVHCRCDVSRDAEVVKDANGGHNLARSLGAVQQRTAGVIQAAEPGFHDS